MYWNRDLICLGRGSSQFTFKLSYYGTKIQKEKSLLNRKPFQLHFLLYHLLSKMSRGLQKCWLKNTFHNIYFLSEIFWKKDIINPIGKGWKNLPIKFKVTQHQHGTQKGFSRLYFLETDGFLHKEPSNLKYIWPLHIMVWWNG